MTIILDGTQGTTTPGLYSNSTFTGTYVDGIVSDYTTGLGRISVGGSDGLAFYRGGVANTESMRIDSSGNVGIGTSSPGYRLNATKNGAASIVAAVSDTQSTVRAECNSVAVDLNTAGSTGEVRTATNHALVFSTNSTERMRIDTSGNVMIGTTTPRAIFTVIAPDATGNGINITNTNTANNTTKYASLDYAGTDTASTWKQSGFVRVYPADANYVGSNMIFATRGSDAISERMRIDSSGRITTPNQPAFFSTITGGTYTAGQTFGGSLVSGQPSSRTANYSNGVFTAPVTGYYSFNFTVYDFNAAGTTYAVYKNGSGYIVGDWFQMLSTSGQPMTTFSYTLYLTANDYVQMGLRPTGTTVNLYTGHSTWAGFFLG